MLLIYRGLNLVERDVTRLAEVEEPRILAAYEMEINMNGIGLAVLKYLSTRERRYRAWAEKDLTDFDGFHSTYSKLISSERERVLNDETTRLYAEFKDIGTNLMRHADEREVAFERVATRIEQIDEIIDGGLQPGAQYIPALSQDNFGKAIAAADMEAELAELGFWTANYQRAPKAEYKAFIAAKMEQFEGALADFANHPLTDNEQNLVRSVRGGFRRGQSGYPERDHPRGCNIHSTRPLHSFAYGDGQPIRRPDAAAFLARTRSRFVFLINDLGLEWLCRKSGIGNPTSVRKVCGAQYCSCYARRTHAPITALGSVAAWTSRPSLVNILFGSSTTIEPVRRISGSVIRRLSAEDAALFRPTICTESCRWVNVDALAELRALS